ncbi:hypothetical protein HZS_4821 [Henneguya salminicola]|nr:hypothetical protein HZS_4821 [Henneguya salminicola]
MKPNLARTNIINIPWEWGWVIAARSHQSVNRIFRFFIQRFCKNPRMDKIEFTRFKKTSFYVQ